MRYNEILQKSAAGELAEKLPTLHKYNYNSIDKLMQHISARHKITGKKLHDLFVHKYGHTPDVWIKKLKSKLGEEGVAEGSGFDQEAGIGIDGKSFKFKIRDLVALADNYPVTKIDPQQFSKQIAGRDEDSTQSMARAEKADLQYPIIVVKRQNGQLWIADGTHRAHKAIMHKLPSINAKIIPIKDMAPFDVDQGVAEGSLNEIYKMPPTKNSSQGLADWAYNDAVKKNAEIIFQDSNTVVFQVGADMIRYIILSEGQPILYLGLTKFLDGWKSGVVAAETEARGQGLATKIYLQASDLLKQPIYSDTTQTDASRLGIWNKLIQMVPGRVVGFDQKTNNDLPLTMTKDGPVVNQNQPLYIDRNKKDSEKPVTQQQRYRTRILKLLPNKQGVAEAYQNESCPHCGGEMVSEELMNEKKDACYYKVKSRYKVWPSAYASGALVKCRKKGSANWGNKSESITLEELEESLHDWFTKEKWVRMDTKGNIKGPCAREPGEGKPKCLPQSKAYGLGKKGRASAAARKRREDPNPERSGKAINVNTKKKTNEEQVNEISNEKIQSYLNRADRQVNNRLDRMSQARERLNKDYEIYHAEDPNHPIKYFTANTPEEAKKYYYDYIKKFDSDVDFDLKLRKSTGLTENALKEGVDSSDDIQKIKDFINWSIKQLHIQKPYPKITLSRNTKVAQQGHHTGVHTEDNKIWVYIENRNLIDIFRTIFHELVHERQSQLNMIKDGDSYPGSPIEAMADMVAGKYLKVYGKMHPEIFQ